MKSEPVSVVLAEDDPLDVQRTRDGIAKLNIANPLVVAKDGAEALDILRGRTGHRKPARPYLVLLDLNLRHMNGFELLREIRQGQALHRSVIFVLTTWAGERDLRDAYEHNIAGYIIKSEAGASYAEAIGMLAQYLRTVRLPTV